jgi:heme exporter protein C
MFLLAGLVSIAVLVWNLHKILILLPDEKMQGAIFRILYFHAPAAMVAGLAVFGALIGSVLYLTTKDLKYDTFAVSTTEVALAFGAVNLLTGMIWARIIWGVWWAWDARLTSMLICWLMYAGYLMLRKAIEEPTTRARNSAALSILTFPGAIITWKSIEWWRTLHPAPVLSIRTGGGRMDPDLEWPLLWNLIALAIFGGMLVVLRMRQEKLQRELDGLRRQAHAL